ncbi:GTPase-associated system all-helical protein GASH [Rhodovarius lipocyclicus]|uniref:GTPase-associated system all-helical protein GASH n=1 Tax=Rhodovarius lipocyclicus TaxID=268410 RepID=UPI001359C778|nr:GTPase-associated system all-helical protein GASH [Rhodovarius lipocyclicus]
MANAQLPAMHADFPRWHTAIGLGDDEARRQARWAGVSTIAADGDSMNIEALLRLAYKSRQPAAAAQVAKIREAYKVADPAFEMSGNDREMQVLAGAALAELMNRGGVAGAEAALAVSGAALGGARKANLPIDLLVLAEDALDRLADSARTRPSLKMHTQTEAPKLDFAKAIAKAQEAPNGPGFAEALVLAAEATRAALTIMTRRQTSAVNALDAFISVQDEELQMLWWLIGQRSEDLDCAFDAVPDAAQALVFAKELAGHTNESPGPPSIKGILSRAGLKERRKFPLATAINAVDPAWLASVVPEKELSPVSTPIHFGIKRQLETGAGDAWVAGWAAAVGVPPTLAFSQLALGVQFYRERLLVLFGDQ